MWNRVIVIFLLLTVLITNRSAASANLIIGKGPVHITGQTPLQILRLDVVPTRHTTLEKGRWELSLFNSLTNRWNRGENYLLDVEILQNVIGLSVGAGKRTEFGFYMPIISRSGGRLDKFIMDFHDAFSLSQAGRTEHPTDAMQVSFVNDSGNEIILLDGDDRGTIVCDISLYARNQIFRGTGWLRSVIVTGLLRFPTAAHRDYYGSGGVDGAMSLATSHHVGPVFLYTTLGYGVYGSGSLLGIGLRPYQWTFFAAVEYPVSRQVSLLLQQLSNSGAASNFEGFSSPTHELTLGVKHALSRHLMLEYGIVENLYEFRNSVDFGLNFGLSYRY